jgi:hypothetical protein
LKLNSAARARLGQMLAAGSAATTAADFNIARRVTLIWTSPPPGLLPLCGGLMGEIVAISPGNAKASRGLRACRQRRGLRPKRRRSGFRLKDYAISALTACDGAGSKR